jgi:YggT family protein
MDRNALTDFIYRVTEPVLRPIRELIPAFMGSIDFSPLVAFLLIRLVDTLLYRILFGL